MKQKIIGKTINPWKWALICLVAIQLGAVWVLHQRLTEIREPKLAQALASQESHGDTIKVGTVTTNKEQVNQTVDAFLETYRTKSLTYEVYTTNSMIIFEGTYTLLGYEVPLYVYFEPYTLETGALQLKITSLSAGTLPLPEADVLKFIAKSYELPKIVEVLPNKSSIIIHLENLENSSGIYLKTTSFDLVNNIISFDIYKKKTVN